LEKVKKGTDSEKDFTIEDNQKLEIVDLMSSVPVKFIKEGCTVQKNRCTNSEVYRSMTYTVFIYGISKSTAVVDFG